MKIKVVCGERVEWKMGNGIFCFDKRERSPSKTKRSIIENDGYVLKITDSDPRT